MNPLKPCGTFAAYARHLRNRTPTCRPCKDAHNAAQRGQYRRTAPYVNTAARIITDHVETFGALSIRELPRLIQRRHDIEYGTIRRAVHRMLKNRRLSSVKDIEGRLIVEVPDGT